MSLTSPKIAIVMGSKSDWATMQEATQILDQLQVPYHVVRQTNSSSLPKTHNKTVTK